MKTFPLRNVDFYINGFTLFTILFLFHLLWIFQGLDVADIGYHLTNQVSAFTGHASSAYLLIFVTDYVGGWWLSLIGKPDIFWARIGGVLIFCLTALISYITLSAIFEKRRVFYIVIISTILITMTIPTVIIDYYSFPAMLLNLELLLISRLTEVDKTSIQKNIYAFFSGFIAVPIILSRLPLISIVLMPIIFVLYHRYVNQIVKDFKIILVYVVVGFLSAVLLFGLFYQYVGLLNSLDAEISRIFYMFFREKNIHDAGYDQFALAKTTYDLFSYLKLYTHDFLFALGSGVIAFPIIYAVSHLRKKLYNIASPFVANSCSLIVMAMILLLCRYAFNLHAELILALLMDAILIIAAMSLFYTSPRDARMDILLLLSLFVMLITPLGSNAGYLCRTVYGMWLVLPLTFLLSYRLRDQLKNKRLKMMFSLNSTIIILLIPIALFAHYRNVFHDDRNRLHLNIPFKYEYLHNIYSDRGRVEVVDDVLAQIRLMTEKGDEVLMADTLFMFYYLTETRPIWPLFWKGSKTMPELDMMLSNLDREKKYPVIVVFSKVYVSCEGWLDRSSQTCSPAWQKDYLIESAYLQKAFKEKLDYRPVWENKAFIIYRRVGTGEVSRGEKISVVFSIPVKRG